jgi:hypothetical protein
MSRLNVAREVLREVRQRQAPAGLQRPVDAVEALTPFHRGTPPKK